MNFPKSVLDAARSAALAFLDDIPTAIDTAEAEIRELPEFEEVIVALLRSAVRELVYQARHVHNVKIKNTARYYGGPKKIHAPGTKAVEEVYANVYQYCIAGTMLGFLLGEQLLDLAKSEQAVGDGHLKNAKLLQELSRLVKTGQRVQDVVSQKKLVGLMRQVGLVEQAV